MKANLSLFTRPLFLFGLVLLISNDFYFKYAFPGIITGKLSDFAGLFIFPYFFSVFFEKRTKIVYVATALYFTFWKLEISQPYMDCLSSLTHLPVYRTVDVTDLIALLILPVSYQYFRKELVLPVKGNLAIQMTVILISAFSFVATTLPDKDTGVNLKSGKEFTVPLSEKQLKEEFKGHMSSKDIYGYFPIDEYDTDVYANLEIKGIDPNNSVIILKEIVSFKTKNGFIPGTYSDNSRNMMKLTTEDYEGYFKEYLIKKYGSAKTVQAAK
jgi:hypothetical protein